MSRQAQTTTINIKQRSEAGDEAIDRIKEAYKSNKTFFYLSVITVVLEPDSTHFVIHDYRKDHGEASMFAQDKYIL